MSNGKVLIDLAVEENLERALYMLQEGCHMMALEKGFHSTSRPNSESLALIHSEVSEALEAIRNGNPPSKIDGISNLEEEMADVVIRVCDFCSANNINLARAILAKVSYNAGRPQKHGKVF